MRANPTRLTPWQHLLMVLALLAGWGALPGRAHAQGGTFELSQAQANIVVNGTATTEDLQLPYQWDHHHPGQQGEARFILNFSLPVVPQEPWGLYLPGVGNAYAVWLNGVLLQRQGDLAQYNGANYAHVPRFIAISPGLLRTTNVISVQVRADLGRRGGLAPLVLGPHDAAHAAYLKHYRWRGTGTVVVMVFSVLVALMALVLWLTQTDRGPQRRGGRDRIYLVAGLAELCWAVRIGDVVVENPPLAWPWWGVVPVLAMAGWGYTMTFFCLEVAQWADKPAGRWYLRWLAVLLAASVVAATWALKGGAPQALTLWYIVYLASFLVFGVVFLFKTGLHSSRVQQVVSLAILFNVLMGLRDWYVFRISAGYADNTLMRYSSVLFGLTLAYVVVTRFQSASAQARELLGTMATRIAQKETELVQSYRQLEHLARQQERTAERAHILRDMHDGVGAHISSAIHQLQSGAVSNDEILHTLRDSLDQLKLSIDAMTLPAGDITALLANLRYRLEPRFTASSLTLQWDVDLLPPVGRLDAHAMRQLQFMLYGALSNVLQHAGASVLRMEAHRVDKWGADSDGSSVIVLRVVDDGCGFDVQAARRKGLASMQERASAIGAHLHLTSQPGRTMVEIQIDPLGAALRAPTTGV